MVVPVERSINIKNLLSTEDDIWVSGLMFFEPSPGTITPGSIVYRIEFESKTFNFFEHPNYLFSNGSPTFDGNTFYAYSDDFNNYPIASILRLNLENEITDIYELEPWNEDSNVLLSRLYENHLFGVSLIQDAEGASTLLRLNKIDLSDSLVWGKTFGVGDKFTTPKDLNISYDGSIFVSSGVYHFNMTGPFSQLHKVDQDGTILWRYESTEESYTIVSDQHIGLISNNEILLTTRVDERLNPEYITNEWYPLPAKFSWLSEDGMLLKDTVFNTPKDVRPFVGGTLIAKKGGIFVYGSWEDEEGKIFGWLLKMTDEGEIEWSKKYKHPKYKNMDHFFEIDQLHEYENGDLVAAGTANIPGQKNEIWILRLNEYGCYGEMECDEIVTTSTFDIPNELAITLFPNPSNGILQWKGESAINQLAIYNYQGEVVLQMYGDDIKKTINIAHLLSGVYRVRMIDRKGNTFTKSFILTD
ncbi:MAG: T9SS type A sorting domain-containing protein [Saprospiraceae bacterium]|nr:T9SS type A sorting domain-containing protein [Saprospiraceae bacterium]